MMMMRSSNSNNNNSSRFPFTASQWQELEHQALVFKYMVSGMPIPPDLLFTIRRSLDSSLSSNFLIHHPQHSLGWNGFQMGFGRKVDPEPGRCRRTDGKKWRCSKEAYPDSKYCERHMHRGRNRSRKPVEILSPPTPTPTPPPSNTPPPPFLSPSSSHQTSHSHFLYPHTHTQETATNFFLKDCRNGGSYGHGMKGGSNDELVPLTMCSSQSHIAYRQHNKHDQHDHGYYDNNHHMGLNAVERDDHHQHKKVMHHFLDEWSPKDKDSWTNSEDKMPSHRTQLSISIPNSLHDFFITQKW